MNTQITILIDKQLKEKAEQKAKEKGLNLSSLIRFLLVNEIEKGEK